MGDLIIGLGNLRFHDAEPLLASLWHTGYRGEVCLLVYDVDLETVRKYRELGVIVVDGRAFIRPDRNRMNSRFFMILDFLSKHHSRYDRVMLSDIRDVIFQSDPFVSLGAADIIYATENQLIRSCPINGAWVMQGYGHGVYENIRDYYISCAGTTLGKTSAILRYLTLMVDEMSTCKILDTNIDQGIHNYLVHMRPVTNSFLDKDSRAIATLHHVQDDRLAVTQRGIELDGALVPVIHQWDRRALTRDYVRSEPKFRIAENRPVRQIFRHRSDVTWSKPARTAESRSVVVYVDNQHHAGRLAPFLPSLRAAGFDGNVVILATALAAPDQAEAAAHGAQVITVSADLAAMPPDNAAHVAFGRQLADIDTHRVFFFSDPAVELVGDPFEAATSGVSLFAEGPNLNVGLPGDQREPAMVWRDAEPSVPAADRLRPAGLRRCGLDAQAVPAHRRADRRRSGEPGEARCLARRAERAGLDTPGRGLDVRVHPNGSFAFFEAWPAGIEVLRGPVLQVGGASPAIIVNARMPDAISSDAAHAICLARWSAGCWSARIMAATALTPYARKNTKPVP